MDGEAGDDHVEGASQVGERLPEIMLDYPHRLVVGEVFARLFEHGRRKVQDDAGVPGPGELDEGEEPTVACAEVQHVADVRRECSTSAASPSVRFGISSARER